MGDHEEDFAPRVRCLSLPRAKCLAAAVFGLTLMSFFSHNLGMALMVSTIGLRILDTLAEVRNESNKKEQGKIHAEE
jgi:hypothetical protein